MHVETLKTFCDLVETGSLSRAARLNLVSQSAVSQQLRGLEQRYGGRLIDRAPRIGARPTELGRLLYEEIKPFLERLAASSSACARGRTLSRAQFAWRPSTAWACTRCRR
jgi:DNA-binding transcriptional LysR family regulator